MGDPELAELHRVIAPELPAHGSTEAPDDVLDAERVLTWLGELIEPTWGSPPAVVGHARGGAIGARFAIEAGDRLSHLVLDSLGLARFRPSPRFAFGLVGFVARPSERSCERVMRQCAFDLGSLRRGWARTGSCSPTRWRFRVGAKRLDHGDETTAWDEEEASAGPP